jgi:hypothetical protein
MGRGDPVVALDQAQVAARAEAVLAAAESGHVLDRSPVEVALSDSDEGLRVSRYDVAEVAALLARALARMRAEVAALRSELSQRELAELSTGYTEADGGDEAALPPRQPRERRVFQARPDGTLELVDGSLPCGCRPGAECPQHRQARRRGPAWEGRVPE